MKIDLQDIDYDDNSNTCELLSKMFNKLETLDCIKIIDTNTLHCVRESDFLSASQYDICVELAPDITINCRINFSSSDYTSTPYICICQTPANTVVKLHELQDLRPVITWNLHDEDCLYNWFSCFTSRLKEASLAKLVSQTVSHQPVCFKFLRNTITQVESSNKVIHERDQSNRSKGVKTKAPHTIDSQPQSKQRKLNPTVVIKSNGSDIISEHRKEFRKKFFLKWMNEYRDNIIQYDSENFEYLTLYLTFEIHETTSVWLTYLARKAPLKKLFKARVAKPKPEAPILVHFTMKGDRLIMKLLSAVNSKNVHTSSPDSTDLQYKVDFKKDTSAQLYDIKCLLFESAIEFHLFQLLK